MTDLNAYFSGGYFLIRADKPDWPQWINNELIPEKLVSLSTCICPRVCLHWGWNPGNKDAALRFGISEDKWEQFVEWGNMTDSADMDVFCMFYSTEAARRFIDNFLLDTADLYLIGTGLHNELEAANWREEGEGEIIGVEKRIEQQLPLELGGAVIGFEVVSYSYSDYGHSWLCSYLEREMHDLYGIRPNEYGLIDDFDDAKKVYEWIAEDNMQGRRAEPEPYDFWLLVSYPLGAAPAP